MEGQILSPTIHGCLSSLHQELAVSLGCHVLLSHTGRDNSPYVIKLLQQFVPDVEKIMNTSCHDGESNMIKASQLKKVDSFQPCAAHALHLLLTVESSNKINELVRLSQSSRNIVSTLHFKAIMVAEELMETEDKELIDKMTADADSVKVMKKMKESFEKVN